MSAWTALDTESDDAAAVRIHNKSGHLEATRFAWHMEPLAEMIPDRGQVTQANRNQLDRVAFLVRGTSSPLWRSRYLRQGGSHALNSSCGHQGSGWRRGS